MQCGRLKISRRVRGTCQQAKHEAGDKQRLPAVSSFGSNTRKTESSINMNVPKLKLTGLFTKFKVSIAFESDIERPGWR
jgi:hypothetical protein